MKKNNSRNNAMDYIANKRNQQHIIQQIRKFGDPELEQAYKNIFNWSGLEDSYIEKGQGNKLYGYNDIFEMFEQTTRGKLKKLYQQAGKYSLNELLKVDRFLSNALWPVIIGNDASSQEALIYQIKTFSPTIAPVALRKLFEDAPTSDNAAELLEVCLKYGNLRTPAKQVLYELGTPQQIRLYERR